MDDQTTDRDRRRPTNSQQVFSSDNDVLPEIEAPVPLSAINRSLLGMFAFKVGCLLAFLALFLFVALIAKFSGDLGPDAPKAIEDSSRSTR